MTTRFLDAARTAYVGLPFPVRRALSPLVDRLPRNLKYGGTYRLWRDRIDRSIKDPDFCFELQRDAIVRLITAAVSSSPFYRETLSSRLGNAPSYDTIVRAWRDLPIIDRDVIASERERMCVVPPSALDRASTGGSSGRPLSFYIDRSRSPTEFAFVMDAWSRLGMQEGDWHAVFRGFDIPRWEERPFEVESSLRELRFSVFHMSNDLVPRYLAEIKQRGIRFLKGYPSALGSLAAYAVEAGLVNENVRGVMLHSELIHEIYRERLMRAFPNAVVRGFYGLSEKCAFATECAQPGHYEFNPLYGYTELLDSKNRPVEIPGQRGQIVSTGLLFPGMPLIRYNTRDEATLVELPERKNGYRLRVADIRPRSDGEMLVTRSRYVIEANSLFMMDDELDSVAELQFEQNQPGLVVMKCVMFKDADKGGAQKFAEMVKEKSRGELDMRIKVVESIDASPRGKRPLTIQKLDVSAFPRFPKDDYSRSVQETLS